MLTSYIRAAMRQARYEIIEDDGFFYGEIPAIPGVWAHAKTLEACREELESVLEGWLLLIRKISAGACWCESFARVVSIARNGKTSVRLSRLVDDLDTPAYLRQARLLNSQKKPLSGPESLSRRSCRPISWPGSRRRSGLRYR